jgi:hypothetical protein
MSLCVNRNAKKRLAGSPGSGFPDQSNSDSVEFAAFMSISIRKRRWGGENRTFAAWKMIEWRLASSEVQNVAAVQWRHEETRKTNTRKEKRKRRGGVYPKSAGESRAAGRAWSERVLAQFKSSADVADAAVGCLQYFIKWTASDLELKRSPDGQMYPRSRVIESSNQRPRDG